MSVTVEFQVGDLIVVRCCGNPYHERLCRVTQGVRVLRSKGEIIPPVRTVRATCIWAYYKNNIGEESAHYVSKCRKVDKQEADEFIGWTQTQQQESS